MSKDVVVRPSPNVVFTSLDDGTTALLHLKTKRYYTLNETGSIIWKCVEDGHDVGAIADRLTTEYEVAIDDAVDYVREFLMDLHKEGLVAP